MNTLRMLFLACSAVVLSVSCSDEDSDPITPDAPDLLMCVHPYFFSGVIGKTYEFSMQSRFAPGEVYCEWEFGTDGPAYETQGANGTVQHAFTQTGNDTVFIRLYDKESGGLLQTMTKLVTIRAETQSTALTDIKGGSFEMGNVSGYEGVQANVLQREFPVRTVTVGDFSIGTYEVTQAEFEFVMGYVPVPANFVGNDLPVGSIDWLGAIAYCNKRSIMEGLTPVYAMLDTLLTCDTVSDMSGISVDATANGYRLPTEAEWEYVARAGSDFDLSVGNLEIGGEDCTTASAQLDEIAWYCGNSDGTIHNVGSLAPNAYGVYDMSGNVREWVWDYWSDNYEGLSGDNPTGPSDGEAHVLRGGSFLSYPYTLRSSSRAKGTSSSGDTFVANGFRVARNR